MIGAQGVADTDLEPGGWVLVMGERWRAVAEAPLRRGEPVLVTGLEGLTVRVRKVGS
jgi:membrane-bound serine protease (ClpP class)